MINKFINPNTIVGILILVITAYLFTQADFIYGVYAEQVRSVIMIYAGLLAIMSPFILKDVLSIGVYDLSNFALGFLITAAAVLAVPFIGTFLIPGQIQEGLVLALGFGFLHSFIKAFFEELIFRGGLPRILRRVTVNPLYPDIISSVLFGIFHWGVTGVGIPEALILMVLGFGWAKVRDLFGIMGATGSHFAYNLAVMGVLSQIVGI